MKKEMKQKLGYLLLAVIVGISYWVGYNFVGIPMRDYGTPIIYFGPIKTIKEKIYVEKVLQTEYRFSNGEIKKENTITKIYTGFYTILAVIVTALIAYFLFVFMFYVFYIDIVRLIYTGEWKRGKKMTTYKDYEK
jgi:predicted PurR-regulated permease PerM